MFDPPSLYIRPFMYLNTLLYVSVLGVLAKCISRSYLRYGGLGSRHMAQICNNWRTGIRKIMHGLHHIFLFQNQYSVFVHRIKWISVISNCWKNGGHATKNMDDFDMKMIMGELWDETSVTFCDVDEDTPWIQNMCSKKNHCSVDDGLWHLATSVCVLIFFISIGTKLIQH
jgi:hypothetical protein